MKRALLAVALICALSSGALAGDIPSTDRTTPQTSSPVLSVIVTIISAIVR